MAHFRPLVKRFPPSRRLHWKKKKALTALNNRKQWLREFDVTASIDIASGKYNKQGTTKLASVKLPSAVVNVVAGSVPVPKLKFS